MTAALSLTNVSVMFGGHVAVDDVTIDVAPGTITGLIGPNGAGKTTLFNVISGLQPATRGEVTLAERPLAGLAPHHRAHLGLARTFQRLELFTSLTVAENVRVAGEIHNVWSDRPVDVHAGVQRTLETTGLTAVAGRTVSEIPTGQARLVELARALMTRPRLLLLDEPASGQDDRETEAFGQLLHRLVDDGITIFVVEHDMSLVMSVCDQIHVLDFGTLIASGTPAEVRVDERVLDAYLGASS